MEQPELRSERLLLRPFRRSDADPVQSLAGDARIADTTAHIPHPYPDGAAEAWIATHPDAWRNGTAICYAMVDRGDDRVVGSVSITQIEDGAGNLGYWVGVPFWGKGYATEAAGLLAREALNRGWVDRLLAQHLVRNPASGRVLLKSGFQYSHRTHDRCGHHPEREPIEVYTYKPQ